jgi:hypothetical protein
MVQKESMKRLDHEGIVHLGRLTAIIDKFDGIRGCAKD